MPADAVIHARPIVQTDGARPAGALPLAGGWCWFDRVEVMERGRRGPVISASDLAGGVLDRLTAPRAAFAGLTLDRPRVMGILNVTPDSFSDGGRFLGTGAALTQARAMAAAGADVIDIGGESTRPGAGDVPMRAEIARTAPVIQELVAGGMTTPISIDTRKSVVARAALAVGAAAINDVSALAFDPDMAGLAAISGVPVVVMHSRGTPATMQDDPRYEDALLDVYDALSTRIDALVAVGIARDRIVVDPGIGFGKTVEHNLALVRGLSLFHGLGLPILLGASRKRFIGTIGGEAVPDQRLAGSLAVALAGVAQGVQMVRVHDVAETRQALALWAAVQGAAWQGETA